MQRTSQSNVRSRLFDLLLLISTPVLAIDADLLWVKQLGGSLGTANPNGMALDSQGNIYCVGDFTGTVDFDPGTGTEIANATNLNSFVSKFEPSGNLSWVKIFGSSSTIQTYSVTVDLDGNVYVVGAFAGAVDFDPGPGTTILTSTGSFNIFILKLEASGFLLWAKQISGNDTAVAQAVAVDDGSVYLCGRFSGTSDFDPGLGSNNFTAIGQEDTFVLKLDESGNTLWARQIGGTGQDTSLSLALDSNENVYLTGYFSDTADFDPGPDTIFISPFGQIDAFVVKLDVGGQLIWAKHFGANTNIAVGNSISLDADDSVYVAGYFEISADFNPGPDTTILNSAGSNDIFVVKLEDSGNFSWARQMGGADADIPLDISIDSHGNVFTCGFFRGSADFDPGPDTNVLTALDATDIFVSKLDSMGELVWNAHIGGSEGEQASSVIVDDSGVIHALGLFQGTVDFDPGADINSLSALGDFDAFVMSFSVSDTDSETLPVSSELLFVVILIIGIRAIIVAKWNRRLN